mmetsp:Transcript_16388/g.31040  ORF Transcript_16388/g.31040 Transcript_16388/m.31040 type:complete len:311 (-) Transcript_16388:283-1215(-)|eukprot:CAMPEP_0176477694 /NCGR_PEP_ID=MMETSP0200_2-20121128/771_1 /TAXON_ID=947934 /ORGANISM="Chaetoceros sp., Strain GSL56" /LENGTH=310 /DNA_ID=CAMNT_0017873545 /DNA_START=48 /DNA_END=980 /DNA_ORIENTATION=-
MKFGNKSIAALALLSLINFYSSCHVAGATVYDYDHVDTWNTEFSGDNGNCDGRKQSPIALETMDCTHYANYEMNQGDCTLDGMEFEINKNGVQMNWKPDLIGDCQLPFFKIPVNAISDDPGSFEGGDTYVHAQTHIHLSSEHTIDGKYFGAELHMVHLNADSTRASVLGTMIRPVLPHDNPTFEQFLKRWVDVMKSDGCDCTDHYTFDLSPNFKLDVYENMEGKDFYHYDGGLTTPGCDEIVWWNFNTDPWNISVRQFNILVDVILKYKPKDQNGVCADKPQTNASRGGSTSRPPQPLNGRKVLKICSFS